MRRSIAVVEMKRQVADDDMRCTGQRVLRKSARTTRVQGVVRDASRAARRGVDLDGRQRAARGSCNAHVSAPSPAPTSMMGPSVRCDGLHDDVDDAAIVKKVLAVLVPA